jgi:hypothetical protein
MNGDFAALEDSIQIELLLEGNRSQIFLKLTRNNPPGPPGQPGKRRSKRSRSSTTSDATEHLQNRPDLVHFVVDSKLTDDNSEREFSVKYGDTNQFYYAFEFKDYIICPAFLASDLKIYKYSCLAVSNGLDQYYLYLLLKKNDEILSLIFSNCFLGPHSFTVPSRKYSLLILNSQNCQKNCFIDYKIFYETKGSKSEFNTCRQQVPNSMWGSTIFPSYLFVPQREKFIFISRYKHIFPDECDLLATILVHADSQSFRKIDKNCDDNRQKDFKVEHQRSQRNLFMNINRGWSY